MQGLNPPILKDISKAQDIYKVDRFDGLGVQKARGFFRSRGTIQVMVNGKWKMLHSKSSRTMYFATKAEAIYFKDKKDADKWVIRGAANQH
ncbi:hypothetical protein N9936_01335 [bacterium]|nr:hypothetical protein [bacterium]